MVSEVIFPMAKAAILKNCDHVHEACSKVLIDLSMRLEDVRKLAIT